MEDTLSLIDQVIDDHKYKMHGIQVTDNAANDIVALFELYKPVEGGTPLSSSDYRQHMSELQSSLDRVEELLHKHFEREEKVLKTAYEVKPEKAISSAISLLMDEHDEIKRHVQREKNNIAEIIAGGLSNNEVRGKSYMVRAYLRHTMKLIEAHIQTEEKLLKSLREELRHRSALVDNSVIKSNQ